jgi:hypothetical protein
LGNELFNDQNLEMEIVFQNIDESHLSQELTGFFWPLIATIVGLLFYFVSNF